MPSVVRLIVALAVVAVACSPDAPPAADDPTVAPPTRRPTAARFVAVGDVGEPTETQRRVVERIVALHAERTVDALLLLGDIVYPDGEPEDIAPKFSDPYRPVTDAGIRLAPALGNHDIRTRGGAPVMEALGMPGRFYTFETGPVAFFALDSNDLDGEQLQWLDAELGQTDRPWRVLFMHHPPYSSGNHGSHERIRDALAPLIREHDVRLVLSGHDHDYERTHPIDGTTYVVAGTGCCLRDVGRSEFTAAVRSVGAVVVVDASDDELVLRAVDVDGNVFDRTTITLAAAREAA